MQITLVTGLCSSGKTTYCKIQNKPYLSFDKIYNYSKKSFDIQQISSFILTLKTPEFLLDGYNDELLDYFKTNYNSKLNVIFIYNDLDTYFETLSRGDYVFMNPEEDFTYDSYILKIKNTINYIKLNLKNHISNKMIENIQYFFRKGNNYEYFESLDHLENMLNENKEERLLKFIDNISGCKYYQSIMIRDNYIREGTEKDWISFENIKKCTTLENKIILDTACFNGYFCFKSLLEKPKGVIGIDNNEPALTICKKIAYYNNYHKYKMGQLFDSSCEKGLKFINKNIGLEKVFTEEINNIDVIFALNYLHHIKNQVGEVKYKEVIDSFFQNCKEIIFEINENEIEIILETGKLNNFKLEKNLESHRKTGFGNRFMLYFRKQ